MPSIPILSVTLFVLLGLDGILRVCFFVIFGEIEAKESFVLVVFVSFFITRLPDFPGVSETKTLFCALSWTFFFRKPDKKLRKNATSHVMS